MATLAEAFVKIRPDVSKVGPELDNGLKGRISASGRKAGIGFGTSFRAGITPILAGAGALFAASGVVSFLKASIAEQTESIKVGKQTAAVLKSTGGAAKITAGQIGDLATAISNKTGIDDEAIQSSENLLLTFTNVKNEVGKGNDVFNQATQAVVDMSAALGQDGKSSAIQLGKALNDPIKGITALSRVGVSFTAEQKKAIAADVKRGDTLKAQKVILAELTKEFGGSAAAIATPGEKMTVAWKNLQETVGGLVLPVLSKLATFATGALGKVSAFASSPAVADFGKRVGGGITTAYEAARKFVTGIDWSPIIRLVQTLWTVITKDLVPALRGLATTYGPQIKAAIGGAFTAIWSAVSALSPVLLAVGGAIKAFFGFIADNKATVETFVGILLAYGIYLKAIALYGKAVVAFQLLWDAAMSASPIGLIVVGVAALAAGIVFLATKTRFFQTLWDAVWGGIKAAFAATMSFLRGNLTGLVVLILGVPGALIYLALHWNQVWGAIKAAFGATVKFLRNLLADLVGTILGVFGAIVHGAASAFGWVPGIGGKLKDAEKSFDSFAASVNDTLRGIDTFVPINIHATFTATAQAAGYLGHHARGGYMKPGDWSWVGENGPELVQAGRSGLTVKSNSASMAMTHTGGGSIAAGGGGVHFHFHAPVVGSKKAVTDLVVAGYNDAIRSRRIRVGT